MLCFKLRVKKTHQLKDIIKNIVLIAIRITPFLPKNLPNNPIRNAAIKGKNIIKIYISFYYIAMSNIPIIS
jgi:hypothetical protein